jgi:tellurite resistance protein
VEPEERVKIIGLIEAVIAADGVVSDEEREFLRRVIERFGITEQERSDRIVASSPGAATATLRSLAPDVQTRVMALLVEAAIVDGTVAPEERAFLLASAASLGIEACALEERIARRLKSNVPGV